MRTTLAAILFLALAAPLAPTASAGCWEQVPGLCVQHPCDGPFACGGCTRLVDACFDLRACLAGEWSACVDVTTDCLHTTCGPPQ